MSTCCFSGHRFLFKEETAYIENQLIVQIDSMIVHGVTDFIAGGAIGFDMMAANAVFRKKEQGYDIRLILALPYPGHDERWNQVDRKEFQRLAVAADEVRYISEAYHRECYRLRNYYMVDHSAYCICACRRMHTGTSQTADYAKRQGKYVINLCPNV